MWYNKNRKTTAHKVGCRFKGSEKSASVNSKLQRRFFYVLGLLCCKNIWMWYNKNRKTTAHKVGCRFIVSENPPQWTANYRGGFSMCILLFVLKNERQQCQYKHTKNHKILEGVIYHRHHLHSNGISATPPCNTVVLIIVSCKQIFDKQDKKWPPSQLLLRRTVVLLC